MKKLFAILAVLSLLMVPCVSMASTMSDSDLADVTGQMGVTIAVNNLQLGVTFSTLTWADLDGFSDADYAGYVNMVIPLVDSLTPFIMHVGVSGLLMTIDVGTWEPGSLYEHAGKSAVNIGISNLTVTIDAIAAYIFINDDKGVDTDWGFDQYSGGYFGANTPGYYQSLALRPLLADTNGGTFVNGTPGNSSIGTDCLGVFGISHITATVSALNLTIMAH